MSAPKNYTVGQMCKGKEVEISGVMERHPLWGKRYARDFVARNEFARRIREAGNIKVIKP